MKVGTLEWSRATGGRLSFGDQVQLVGQTLVSLLGMTAQTWRKRLGLARRIRVGEFAPPEVPWAFQLCQQLSPDWLVNHCLRSYAFGALLAQRDGLKFDRELLAIICLLHDLGFTPEHAPTPEMPCFAVSGGLAAHRVCRQHLDERSADRVAEAITLHLNSVVSVQDGVEAHLLRQGSACDVIGARLGQIDRPLRERVLQAYPRLDLKRELRPVFRACDRPRTRTAFLCRLGFLQRVERAPFPT